ncbi:unnamed protein product [Adineta ricciae]|uniref:Uncharacterized protein n=1 Tax=Adineta ricciae TaxID=249248 RepID=A0A816E898_ADIRI|nr:unnamed protein product [Adineta ricciae]
MRRHSVDPESIRKQIISVFTTSSRKRQNSTTTSTTNTGILGFARRTRRFSVPDKKYLHVSCPNAELHTIDELKNALTD